MSKPKTSGKNVVIAGAGPAGLTAAYELLDRNRGYKVTVLEASDEIGGISRTVKHNGNRIDIGGHRFFSKDERVMDWWRKIMPMQSARSLDDELLGLEKDLDPNGADPSKEDRVMLVRRRVSRIFYLRKFFDYPISLKKETFTNMGLKRTLNAGFGYLGAMMHKRDEKSLEDFYINRFGKPLYNMFFEDYTTKVWGLHPSKLGADWGSQRVKGLSIMAILRDVATKALGLKKRKVETSLIEEFIYPKLGPGQLWECVASDIRDKGGDILMENEVTAINIGKDCTVESVEIVNADGKKEVVECDHFVSSMPIKDLVGRIKGIDIPAEVKAVAESLPYRDFITVGLLVDKMKIRNKTSLKTYKGRVPDTWIYIQERDVKIGRLQVFNNWSPYMVEDYENKEWIGLEYFCSEGDSLWEMDSEEFIGMAIKELEKIGIIDSGDVRDSVHIRVKKAYPVYYGSYYSLQVVKDWLDGIPNLWCVGRNGQHRYNNMDHSMLTAMQAADQITAGNSDKSVLWQINSEEEYHESK